ncbi:hypothetical protein RCH16_000522 [Cryobacterium sp. MP_M5]|uniref:hypothetical protein n=1 Tax=unclassified Cryobacterium TaxID=2649013 RepID=UPI0018C9AF92|nr:MULTISPECIES: hypothetical protein [unclassified Cryobacterium]MBG6057330.1 hypothetical protein [Cryobacterium sp. MP_M3]MEC5175529.1 hypothetical protein [Cryobacterium sp. MP_M5]
MRARRGPVVSARMPVALLLAGLLAGTSGCASAPDRPEPPTSTGGTPVAPTAGLPTGVTVRIYQTRFDYADRVLELSVSNAGRAPVDLRSARFDSTRFTAAADWSGRLRLEPGMTRDLRVRLAAAVCAPSPAAPNTPATTPIPAPKPAPKPTPTDTVTLVWAEPGAGTGSATVPATDDTGALDRIEGEDCLAGALTRLLRIDVAAELRVDGSGSASAAWIDLTLTPTGAPGAVTLDQAGSTPLLAAAGGLDWPIRLTLDAATPPTRVALGLRPARCDPHAIAEDKRGTVFPLTVHVTAGPGSPERTGDWDLVVDDALRARIYAWIADRCGY